MEIRTEAKEGTVIISAQEYKNLIETNCLLIQKLNAAGTALTESVDTYDQSKSLFVRDRAVLGVLENYFPEAHRVMMDKFETEWAKKEAEKEADDK